MSAGIAMAELTESERLALAREVAADNSGYARCYNAFCAGWDAAMEHVKQAVETVVSPVEPDVQTKEQQ